MDFVLGSRMMGGGFGGCTINLLKTNSIEKFQNYLEKAYFNKFGIHPEFIHVTPSEGAGIL
ncbi:hypothetical protein V8V91_09685 [Algoriphagus halophilus]|uniref:hypothetical protein n=1 Tax=Algoriphagus halophilus TaxID=226505 RepID=UPI0035902201